MLKKNATILALDLGGTKLAAGSVRNGKIIGKISQWPSPAKQPKKNFIELFKGAIAQALAEKSVDAIAIDTAGQVDMKRGVLVTSPNYHPSIKNVNVKALIEKKFGLPVFVANDAKAFTVGEAHYGLGKGKTIVLGITFGTGIGAALVVNGHVLYGAHGTFGEIGQSALLASTSSRHDPIRLEEWGAAKGLVALHLVGGHEHMSAAQILDGAAHGIGSAMETVRRWQHWVATGIANAILTYDPDVVIVGGGLSERTELWGPTISQARSLLAYGALKRTPITRTRSTITSSLLGIASMSLQR